MSTPQHFAETLPRLRAFARTLTGSNASGDAYLRATLDAVLAERTADGPAETPRSIYRLFHAIWAGIRESDHDEGLTAPTIAPRTAFTSIAPTTREAILLKSIGGLNDARVPAKAR